MLADVNHFVEDPGEFLIERENRALAICSTVALPKIFSPRLGEKNG
jgi:hypothetical protein